MLADAIDLEDAGLGDIHAREHRIRAKTVATQAGGILAFEIDDLAGLEARGRPSHGSRRLDVA